VANLRVKDGVGDAKYLKASGAGTDGDPHVVEQLLGTTTTLIEGAFTRPANTTPYSIGDGMTDSTSAPAAISFANAVRVAGYGAVLPKTWKMTFNDTTVTNANFRLWLYLATPAAIPNDNEAYTPAVYADRASIVGYVDFAAFTAGSDGAYCFGTPVFDNIPIKPAATTLYGLLQAKAAYTPISEEVFHIMCGALQD
jgi:hypothetical protein